MIRAVLFDLDGVIRHFDPEHVADIERRNGLVAGTIEGIAFSSPLIEAVTTGRITRADWVHRVGELAGNAGAAEEWGRQATRVDQEVLELADEVRRWGLTAAVRTNGTDTMPAEVAALGLGSHFDAIFNSADIVL